ncbi:NlpC/P60 family protein [Pseudopedobacter beijingensis]|uniref:NlpC/P60 family protein n=1 Tax=Pseudopedobacter beijingensis TaxID=1207056 RepID=A0ABW4ID83_9SPHI
MEKILGTCFLSVIPMRAQASHKAEMISQLLFGETFEILEKQDEWVYIKNTYDDYMGWVEEKQIIYIKALEPETEKVTSAFGVSVVKQDTDNKSILPLGATLPFSENNGLKIGDIPYDTADTNDVVEPQSTAFREEVLRVAKQFIDVPYLWGGRTHFGIDCSGFSQIVYKVFGIKIKRDAWQQAEEGKLVAFLSEAQTGDLAFFDNEEGRITHVGIMINNSLIIHASGRVKIDLIDDYGIFSSDLKQYSHKLRIIKRFI